MIKKYEPLRNRLQDFRSTLENHYDIIEGFTKEDIVSAVKFYKRYHNDVYSSDGYELLKKEQPEIYDKFIHEILEHKVCCCIYNYWLYEYCFRDAII